MELEPVEAGPQDHGDTANHHHTTNLARMVMQININLIKEILDAVSFVFVTPEFLGEKTLCSFRKRLKKASDYLGDNLVEGAVGLGSFATLIIVLYLTDPFWLYAQFRPLMLLIIKPLLFVVGVLIVLVCMLLVVYFVVSYAERLLVRRVMFVFGVLVFFSSRAISMWYATWGEHTPAPAETPQHTGAPQDFAAPVGYSLTVADVDPSEFP